MLLALLQALNARVGSAVPGVEPTPEEQALEAALSKEKQRLQQERLKLETELKRREQLLEAADAKLREHEEKIQHFEGMRKAAAREEEVFDAQGGEAAKKRATAASVQKSYWWKEEGKASLEKTDIWNARVERLNAKKAAAARLAKFNADNPP
jgi:hypothetical protein